MPRCSAARGTRARSSTRSPTRFARVARFARAAVWLLAVVGAVLAATDSAPASGRPEAATSLARQVRVLEQTVGSLKREIARLQSELAQARRSAADPDAWQHRESWQRLRRGMSRFEVFAVLGEPGRVAQYDGFERWEYPDFLGGRVSFDDAGRLVGWREPPAPPHAGAGGP